MTDQTASNAHPAERHPGQPLSLGRRPETDRAPTGLPVMVEGEPASGGGVLVAIHAQVTPYLDRRAAR
jgi:hypothetical protein